MLDLEDVIYNEMLRVLKPKLDFYSKGTIDYRLALSQEAIDYVKNSQVDGSKLFNNTETVTFTIIKHLYGKLPVIRFKFKATDKELIEILSNVGYSMIPIRNKAGNRYFRDPINIFSNSPEKLDTFYIANVSLKHIALPLTKWLMELHTPSDPMVSVKFLPPRLGYTHLSNDANEGVQNIASFCVKSGKEWDYYQQRLNKRFNKLLKL